MGSGGNLVFDKAIDKTIHQQLTEALALVESVRAQQMLDALASNILFGQQNPKFMVRFPLKVIDHFTNVSFDPTAGLPISRRREREAADVEKRKLEKAEKEKPYKNPAIGKTSLVDCLKGKAE